MPRVYVRRDPLERLLEHVEVAASGCWIVQNVSRADGYGAVSLGGKGSPKILAHRLTYERFIGPLTADDLLHHRCETRACCNPWHLKRTTRQKHPTEHRADRCRRGHSNWRIRPNGERACRTCHTDRAREKRKIRVG